MYPFLFKKLLHIRNVPKKEKQKFSSHCAIKKVIADIKLGRNYATQFDHVGCVLCHHETHH